MLTSEKTIEIYKAFISFQSEVTQPKKNATNPHFKSKYSTLDEIIKTITPPLTKYGLAVMQEVTNDNEIIYIKTRLIHVTGEWIESDPLKLKCEKNTPQGQGSAITYGRRYSLSALLGISSEEDDDANNATNKPVAIKQDTITAKEAKFLFETAKNNEQLVRDALKVFGYTSTKEIKLDKYNEVLNYITTNIIKEAV